MDYKDILAIIIVIIAIFISGKLFPNNPLAILGNNIKLLFRHKK